MADTFRERNDALKKWVQPTLTAAFPVTTLEVGTTKWAATTAQLDLAATDGAPQFVQLAFWAQSHSSSGLSTAYDMDIAVFLRQVKFATPPTEPSAMFPGLVCRLAWSADPTKMLSSPSNPMEGAQGIFGRTWYAALSADFSMPDGAGSNVWISQNAIGAELVQQAALTPVIEIPLKGFNQIAIMCRRGASSTSPGTMLIGYKLR